MDQIFDNLLLLIIDLSIILKKIMLDLFINMSLIFNIRCCCNEGGRIYHYLFVGIESCLLLLDRICSYCLECDRIVRIRSCRCQ